MTPRVLVVEDNPVNLELVTELLEREGCRVLPAPSAEAAIRLAATERPDLVLMDLQLPGMTGYEATRRLKAAPATAAIPVLALTSYAMRGDDLKASEAGCDGYLTKPLDTNLFRKTVRRFLARDTKGE
ncbi:MAG: response regulator [candidate division NC10 bacterium]|nr:response regulator [candidate division NC10 bacterium]